MVVGVIRVMLSHSNISAAIGKYGVCERVRKQTNMRINLINYFYFFLDLQEQEAYSATQDM